MISNFSMITHRKTWTYTWVSDSHSYAAYGFHFVGAQLLQNESSMNIGPAPLFTLPLRFQYGHLMLTWLLLCLSSPGDGKGVWLVLRGFVGSAALWPCPTWDNTCFYCVCGHACPMLELTHIYFWLAAWTDIARGGWDFCHKSKQKSIRLHCFYYHISSKKPSWINPIDLFVATRWLSRMLYLNL